MLKIKVLITTAIILLLLSTLVHARSIGNKAIQIVAGYDSLALKSDGTVWTWGGSSISLVNNGIPKQVTELTNVIMITRENLALKSDGSVWSWRLPDDIPERVINLSNVTMIASGKSHHLALKMDDTVWAWGKNDDGQLGDGTNIDSNIPVQVLGLSHIIKIAAGTSHSIALKDNGTVWAWGANNKGQLGDGTSSSKNLPVQVLGLSHVTNFSAGFNQCLAVDDDGTIWEWGNSNYTPDLVQNISNVSKVSVGSSHYLALKNDNTVWAWGSNSYGQLGDGTNINKNFPTQVPGLSHVTHISAGEYYSLIIKDDGTIWAFGTNSKGQLGNGETFVKTNPIQVTGLSSVSMIGSGYNYSLALKDNGTVWAWGENYRGNLGDGTTTNKTIPVQILELNNIKKIEVGLHHSLALKHDGTVWAWGDNNFGQLGDNTTVDKSTPVEISGLFNVTSLSCGEFHSLALMDNGTVWAWGRNDEGQLGDGTTTNKSNPVEISGISNVKMLSAGDSHTLALKNDGTVWAWGSDSFGQLRDDTKTDSPVQILDLSNIIMVSAGCLHSLALKNDGTIWAWGLNWLGQLGLGPGSRFDINSPVQIPEFFNVTKIATGNNHSFALKNDGSVWAWGYSLFGQLCIESTERTPVQITTLSNLKMIDGGEYHSVGLKDDGTVLAWGFNKTGQLGYGYPTFLPEPAFSEVHFSSNNYATPQGTTLDIQIINASQKNIDCTYTTIDGTAIAGIDYVHSSGNLTFNENDTQKNISITILKNPDSLTEKNFTIRIDSSEDIFLNNASLAIINISSCSVVNAPYSQTFNQNMPANGWTYHSTKNTGRIFSILGRLRMDNSQASHPNLNEAILNIDLTSVKKVQLAFFQQSIANDVCTSLPVSYTGHYDGDGISISNDGQTWYRIMDANDLMTDTIGKNYSIDLSSFETKIQSNFDPNFCLNSMTQIKFQQYGTVTYPSGGREWDNISITGNYPPVFNTPLTETLIILEDQTEQIEIKISDPNGDDLTLTCHSTNSILLPDNQIIFENNILSIQPASNKYGRAEIRIFISDGNFEIIDRFYLIVTPVNDPPTFIKGTNLLANEDSGPQTISWTSHIRPGPSDESNQNISFIIENIDNPSILGNRVGPS